MEPAAPKEIAKVQRYCRYAQACCLVLFVIIAVAGPISVVVTLFTVGVDFYISWPSVGLIGLGRLAILAFVAAALAYLYALFGDLGRGTIYTAANVRRARRVGKILMALGALEVLLTFLSAVLIRVGAVPPALVSSLPIELSPQSLMFVLVGSLIVLISWILEVGRHATEDAERLRSEAALVV